MFPVFSRERTHQRFHEEPIQLTSDHSTKIPWHGKCRSKSFTSALVAVSQGSFSSGAAVRRQSSKIERILIAESEFPQITKQPRLGIAAENRNVGYGGVANIVELTWTAADSAPAEWLIECAS